MRPIEFLRPVYPVSYTAHLLDVSETIGLSRQHLLQGINGVADVLKDPKGKLTHQQTLEIFLKAESAAVQQALPFIYGKAMHLTWHGHLGQAVLASDNLREALSLAARFVPIRGPGLSFSWMETGADAVIYLDSELGNERAERFLTISLLTFFAYTLRRTFDSAATMQVTISAPEPAGYPPVLARNAGTLTFGHSRNSLSSPARLLDLPSRTRDDESKHIAVQACIEEMQELISAQLTSDRVRSALRKKGATFPTQAQVCRTLGLTSRSLTRKLSAEGVSYRDVVNTERVEISKCLLCSSETSIDRISVQLGYSDASNFARAFKRATGISPTEYRQSC